MRLSQFNAVNYTDDCLIMHFHTRSKGMEQTINFPPVYRFDCSITLQAKIIQFFMFNQKQNYEQFIMTPK